MINVSKYKNYFILIYFKLQMLSTSRSANGIYSNSKQMLCLNLTAPNYKYLRTYKSNLLLTKNMSSFNCFFFITVINLYISFLSNILQIDLIKK